MGKPTKAQKKATASRRFADAIIDFACPPMFDPSLEDDYVPDDSIPYSQAVRLVLVQLAEIEAQRLIAMQNAVHARKRLVKSLRHLCIDNSASHRAVQRFLGMDRRTELEPAALAYLELLEDDGVVW